MVHAAATGLVDFSKARIRDPAWWNRLWVLFAWQDRQLRGEVARSIYQQKLAQVSSGVLSPEDFKKTQQSARETFFDIRGCVRPWEGKNWEAHKKKEFATARKAYMDATGNDPHDPAFLEREKAAIAAFMAKRKVVDPQQQEEQKVARLLRAKQMASNVRKRRRR